MSFGNGRSIGNRLWELKIDHGPGYRIYFTRVGDDVVVLLCGGDKSSQQRDISRAADLLRQLKE